MCHDVQIPHSQDGDPTWRVSVTASKLLEPKNDNGCQRQTASRHRIPPVRRVCLRGNRDKPPECVRLGWIRELCRGSEELRNEGRP
jgi:hypothetical protein